MLSKIVERLKSLHLAVQILVAVGALLILVLLLLGLYKMLPLLILMFVIIILYMDDIKDLINKHSQPYDIQLAYEDEKNERQRIYQNIAEVLYPVIKTYANAIGMHISNAASIYSTNNQSSGWNGFTRYKYKVQLSKNDTIDTEQLRLKLQEAFDQKNEPIWIVDLNNIGSHLVIYVILLDSDNHCRYKMFYEKQRILDNAHSLHFPKDQDF